jgi:hypothetical protein
MTVVNLQAVPRRVGASSYCLAQTVFSALLKFKASHDNNNTTTTHQQKPRRTKPESIAKSQMEHGVKGIG